MTLTTSPSSRRRAKWRWMIPVLMLILAVLACDETYSLPPEVWQVEADAGNPGRAYALVYEGNQRDSTVSTQHSEAYKAYETDDYGQHWQHSDHVFSKTPANSLPLTMGGDDLDLNSRIIWSFPRPTFRQFFTDSNSTVPRFLLSYGTVSNSLQGDTLYVGMGSQGVLVGHVTSDMTLTDWQITANGIDLLNPLPLTIVNPATLLGIVAVALLVPPYALLHGFLLYCVWAYLLPRKKARSYAIRTTLGLMVVAAVGAAFWLTNVNTEFYPVVAIVTAITVFVGVTLTFVFAAGQSDIPNVGNLALAAALISLIVPAGVAAIYLGWWAVYLLVFGYLFFRRPFFSYFSPKEGVWRERWLADRMAIETLVVAVAISLGLFIIIGALRSALIANLHSDLISIFDLGWALIGLGAGLLLIGNEVTIRLRPYHKVKIGEGGVQFFPRPINRDIQIAVIKWLVVSVVATVATFVGQLSVQGWFTTLTR